MSLDHRDILGFDYRPPQVDNPDLPNVARIYDYMLGGSTNTAVDRRHAEQNEQLMPGTAECARTNRQFAATAVRVAVELGIRQFLDLGAGIPTADGLHAVALHGDPTVRWVAVDNELVAVSHGELTTEGDDRVRYIYADFTHPHDVLDHPVVRDLLDFREPIAIIAAAALHLVDDSRHPRELVQAYRDATVPGSALILSHGTLDDPSVPQMHAMIAHYQRTNGAYTPRSRAEVQQFAEGYTLLTPGVVLTCDWRYDMLHDAGQPPKAGAWAFVGIRD